MVVMETEFSTHLIQARQDKGWSQRELGRRAGVTGAAISQIESNSANPSADFVVKLAHALSADPVRLLRLAGILPDVPAATEQQEALQQMIISLTSPADVDAAFRMVAGLTQGRAQDAGPLPAPGQATNARMCQCDRCPLDTDLSRQQRTDAMRSMLAQLGEAYYPVWLRLVTEQLEDQKREENERPAGSHHGTAQPERAEDDDVPTTKNHPATPGVVRRNY